MKRLSAITMGLLFFGLTVFGCAHQSRDAGWITLLDGSSSSLENWTPVGDANWRLVDGVLQVDKRGKVISVLLSKNSYADFQLRAEFWVDAEANSGIYIRCTDPNKISSASAYEVNIYDQRPDPSYGTGAIVGVAKVSPMPKAGGQWNTFEITAKGPHLIVIMNGNKTVDVQDSKFASGRIGLQYDKGVVKFRKVEIKPL